MSELLALFAAIGCMQVVYLSGYLLYCALLRVQLERVELFMPPFIYRQKIGDIEFRLGSLPFSCSVKPVGFNEPPALDGKGLAGRPGFLTSGLWISSILALVIGGTAILGWPEFSRHVVSGFSQVAGGALAPTTKGKALVLAYFDFAHYQGFLSGVAIICAKHASLCLIPVPGQNLFHAIFAVLPKTIKWQPSDEANAWELTRTAYRLTFLGLLVFLFWSFAWLYAIGLAAYEHAHEESPHAWVLLLVSVVILLFALRTRDRKLHPALNDSSGLEHLEETLPLG